MSNLENKIFVKQRTLRGCKCLPLVLIDDLMGQRKNLIHPGTLILVLLMAGISALFLAFGAAYLYVRITKGGGSMQIPPLFYFNTLIILCGSISLEYARQRFENDETAMLLSGLLVTLLLSLSFLVLQIFAFRQLFENNVYPSSGNPAAFLYLITGLHFLHLTAGIPFLSAFTYKAFKRSRDQVRELLFLSDPDEKRKIRLIGYYWHFLGGLWVLLLVFFILNHIV